MARINDRNPDMYTISVPQVLFSPLPVSGDLKFWVDYKSLVDAFMGITSNNGFVLNTFGNAVGTPDEIMHDFYLGALDTSSIGGDVEELVHTVSNLGYEEADRIVVLQRPLNYTVSFDEPDQKNLCRFMVSQETDLGMMLKQLFVQGETFEGTTTSVVSVIDASIGDPTLAVETIINLWAINGGKGLPPDGTYGFIIGGDNTFDTVGDWEHMRQWIAYATFDFDAKSHSPWTFIRPEGTVAKGQSHTAEVVPVNYAVMSIYDSAPVINNCGSIQTWNAKSTKVWTGYGWLGADEGFYGFSIINTARSFKRAVGCALIASLTDIGVSYVHAIPRVAMIPEGNLEFSSDSWIRGQFTMSVMRDAKAKMYDRSPTLAIPFGFVQTFHLPAIAD